ncbi:unnamed protein product [Schistosoma haematobium]|nr:unnamed protein product [Schistosoma haematobium]
MGTFLGHIYPGLLVVIIGLRNLWINLRSFYTEECNHNGKNDCRNPHDFKSNLKESIFYIIAGIICSVNEIITALMYDGYYFGGHSYQHMTIFIMILLYGVIRIILSYKLPHLFKQICDLFYLMMGCAVYFLLMFHLHKRAPFDTHVHIILVHTILFTIISHIAQIISNSNPIFSLMHNFCFILIGSWLCHIGLYLYSPWSMYYYCDRQGFEDNLITTNSSHKQSHDLYNHILVCILAEPDAPLLGLHSFVMPLRASNFHPNQLRTILFLGDIKFLQREWSNIANFPKVYTLAGSALSRADLRAARIQYSSVCVILGSRGTVKVDDPYMLDKEVILCTLNIRAMQFSPYHRHKTFVHNVHKRRSGSEIPLITELMTDNNIHYLDPDHSGGLQIAASLTAPFAKGIAFTNSVLDVLASTAYFDRNSMTLIRHLSRETNRTHTGLTNGCTVVVTPVGAISKHPLSGFGVVSIFDQNEYLAYYSM